MCDGRRRLPADTDTMLARLAEFAEYRDRLRAAFDDAERIELLRADKPSFKVGTQRQQQELARHQRSARPHREAGRAAQGDDRRGARRRDQARGRRASRCTSTGRSPKRRVAGELDFHDLLVLAPHVAARSRARRAGPRPSARSGTARILIDEFQDTDPIQVEIAALLGSDDPADGDATVERDERRPGPAVLRRRSEAVDLPLPPGRHRHLPRRRRSGSPTRRRCSSRATSGSAPAVLAWINHVFAELIQPVPGVAARVPRRSIAARPVPPEHDRGVVLLGVEPHADEPDAGELREREAADVAAIARAAVAEGWPVDDKEREEWRPARLGDVCILLPARTSLGFLEQALGDAGVPYRAETSSLVYGSREVRDLLMTLRAVDDPSDALALVSRAAVVGVRLRRRRPLRVPRRARRPLERRRHRCPRSLPADDPVADAMRFLGELHAASASGRRRASSSNGSCASARVLEVGALTGRFRDVARRVRFLDRPGARVRRRGRAARCATTSRGRSCRAPKARGSSRRCCPRPTTTRCAS